ncbi:MAG: hypothetical protein CVV02_12825 [Firmicutes bacterium HGW-Firmicutes-7]|nr:MAG: hypothetical protein CVV02_12825 [Firmicutes bacterium HGW-Firmicutes-7]
MLFKNSVILIVDDSYTIRHQVKLLLKKYDLTVVEACDKFTMLNYLSVNNKPVDLIIMDLGLKNETGYDLMKCIREHKSHKNTPIIVLTGNAKKNAVIATIPYSITYYAIKPIDPYDLSLKVLTAIELSSKNKLSPSSPNQLNNTLGDQNYENHINDKDYLVDIEKELHKTNMSKINKVLDIDISPIKPPLDE